VDPETSTVHVTPFLVVRVTVSLGEVASDATVPETAGAGLGEYQGLPAEPDPGSTPDRLTAPTPTAPAVMRARASPTPRTPRPARRGMRL
jgi:hypothetical protein